MSTEPTGFNWPLVYTSLFLLQWLFNAGVAAWLYLRKADGGNADAVQAVAERLAKFIEASGQANEQQNVRLERLETAMKHMPTDEEIGAIREDVAFTKSRVDGITEALRRVERQTNLIHEHLLRRV